MGRYWRTLRSFWGAALAAELEYQINLLIELLATGGNLAGSLFVLSLFFRSGHGLGGWSWEAALVVLGMYTVLDGIASTLLQPNLSTIVSHVQNGSLDYVLLKPIDSQFWLSLRTVSPWGLPGIVLGVVLMVVGAVRTGATPSLQDLLLTGLMLICGSLILYSLWFILAATSIWFVKVWNATEVLRSFLAAGRYPISAYPIGLRLFFTVVVPVAFLTTVPAEALLGRANLSWLTASGVVTILSLLASRWFWKYALRFYTSASS
ncbi:ABC transporter permease [Synechococcus sp. CBW1006]|uniref:ABC transporter permease n=1 Tax=Synechococcus sp. CBW1006 TaxID=1353138 RepID=UPI0018CF49F3|nr:ABC-2 family transporter protein [Synechococcus sp. CBW1006]QPN68576.1 ABC-2 family transporter protein [Synechococcus sp. CBW1006]